MRYLGQPKVYQIHEYSPGYIFLSIYTLNLRPILDFTYNLLISCGFAQYIHNGIVSLNCLNSDVLGLIIRENYSTVIPKQANINLYPYFINIRLDNRPD
jgi:hypothetical protein